jgi:hypothetical protein
VIGWLKHKSGELYGAWLFGKGLGNFHRARYEEALRYFQRSDDYDPGHEETSRRIAETKQRLLDSK